MDISQDLIGLVGKDLGVSEWMEIDQDRIDKFADATNDPQWIHVDRDKAAQGPFGTTIAHGFLTLALTVPLGSEIPLDVGSPTMSINYGLEKVRFPAPVPVGSRIRARANLSAVEEVPGGIQVNRVVTMEIQGQDKPAMVAETVSRYYY